MHIKSIRIRNYKSYDDSRIDFATMFNVIVGQNNSGKTALLEALDLSNFVNHPRKRMESGKPARQNPASRVDIEVALSGGELKDIYLANGGQLSIPVSINDSNEARTEVARLFAQQELVMPFSCEPNGSGWTFAGQPTLPYSALIEVSKEKDNWTVVAIQGQGFSTEPIRQQFLRSIYFSRAERLTLSRSSLSSEKVLGPRAANLPTVLLNLQLERRARYDRLNQLLNKVFPNIHGVSARRADSGEAVLSIWNIDPNMEYPELAVDLSESGTGVGQAIAILFALVSADFPRIFVVDEPNSFLHPSAVRTLFQILKQEAHQYIISTHAAELVAISEPSTLHLIRWENGFSRVEALKADKIQEVRRALGEVGVRLGEVFGADQIVWVEGDTERLCFPLIAAARGFVVPAGTAIVAMLNTGDFEGKKKNADLIWKIYERLSSSNALLPPALAFSFDREGRTDGQIVDLRKRSRGMVSFLPRKMYESYLIQPSALSAVISEYSGETVSTDTVRDWLTLNGGDTRYEASKEWKGRLDDLDWLRVVHGGKLLKNLFEEVTLTRLFYDKVVHSVRLTEWLLRTDNAPFSELVDYVGEVFSKQE
ncbi:AAA family ATPase [Bradyrhizobium sp. AZCC 1678]|uniref:AAA family ATPase n=1 Tax=Bradyrhizobium sp. AZCC 1678 TaxID=3117030 RepID=UPI002FEF828A